MTSRNQKAIESFLENKVQFTKNDKTVIPPFEIDIMCHAQKVGIEYNSYFYHEIRNSSSKKQSKTYHKDKTDAANKKNIKLIHIFDEDWFSPSKWNILISNLHIQLGLKFWKTTEKELEDKIMTNTLVVALHDFIDSSAFLKNIDDITSEKYSFMYFKNKEGEIVSAMIYEAVKNKIFIKEFVSKLNYDNYFHLGLMIDTLKTINYTSFEIELDRCIWSDKDNFATKLGFKLKEISEPKYRIVKDGKITLFTEENDDKLIEKGNALIYDAGWSRYIL